MDATHVSQSPLLLGIGLIPTAVLGDCIGQAQRNLKITHNNVKIWVSDWIEVSVGTAAYSEGKNTDDFLLACCIDFLPG